MFFSVMLKYWIVACTCDIAYSIYVPFTYLHLCSKYRSVTGEKEVQILLMFVYMLSD